MWCGHTCLFAYFTWTKNKRFGLLTFSTRKNYDKSLQVYMWRVWWSAHHQKCMVLRAVPTLRRHHLVMNDVVNDVEHVECLPPIHYTCIACLPMSSIPHACVSSVKAITEKSSLCSLARNFLFSSSSKNLKTWHFLTAEEDVFQNKMSKCLYSIRCYFILGSL